MKTKTNIDSKKVNMDISDKNTVFVYGTLKKNCSNNYFLRDSRFICDGETELPFLFLCDVLPYAVKKSDDKASVKIKGNVYEVTKDVLESIDRLEGHPDFYKRDAIWVINTDTGHRIYSWMYFVNKKFDQKYMKTIKDGCWKDYIWTQ